MVRISTRSRPTRTRFRRYSSSMRPWSFRTEGSPGSAPSPPGRTASCHGGPSRGRPWPRRGCGPWRSSCGGVFEKRRFLDLIRHFTVFEDNGKGQPVKKMAGYHQFHAVGRAIEATMKASNPSGDGRGGVVWHTQGSGKSLTMVFYVGRLVLNPAMENPTIVVITDRNGPGRPAFRDVLPLPRDPPPDAGPGQGPGGPAETPVRRLGRGRVHHDPEVLPRGEGRQAPAPFQPPEHCL